MIEGGAGENQGGVGFAEVEFDSPTLGEVTGRYMVRSYMGRNVYRDPIYGQSTRVDVGRRLRVYPRCWHLAGRKLSYRLGLRAWTR